MSVAIPSTPARSLLQTFVGGVWRHLRRNSLAFATWVLVGVTILVLLDNQHTTQVSQRAWVVADAVKVRGLTWYPTGEYLLNVNITIRNAGVSVATESYVWAVIRPNNNYDLAKAWEAVCAKIEEIRKQSADPWPLGAVIAPGQTLTENFGWADHNEGSPDKYHVQRGLFILLGCIKYRDQFKNEHHTRFSFFADTMDKPLWDGSTFTKLGWGADAN